MGRGGIVRGRGRCRLLGGGALRHDDSACISARQEHPCGPSTRNVFLVVGDANVASIPAGTIGVVGDANVASVASIPAGTIWVVGGANVASIPAGTIGVIGDANVASIPADTIRGLKVAKIWH